MKKNKKGEAGLELMFNLFMICLGLGLLFLIGSCEPTVTKETHNGHKYLVRRQALEYSSSMVHDPDCPCFKKDTVESGN